MDSTPNKFSISTTDQDLIDALAEGYVDLHLRITSRFFEFPSEERLAAVETIREQHAGKTLVPAAKDTSEESAWEWLNTAYMACNSWRTSSPFARESKEYWAYAFTLAMNWLIVLERFCYQHGDGERLVPGARIKSIREHNITGNPDDAKPFELGLMRSARRRRGSKTSKERTIPRDGPGDAISRRQKVESARSRRNSKAGQRSGTSNEPQACTGGGQMGGAIPRRAGLIGCVVLYEENGVQKRVEVASYGEDFVDGPYYRLRSSDGSQQIVHAQLFDAMIREVACPNDRL